ncbi:hypothetical protein FOC88_27455 (plasmid) [Bacillus thuringiensis]|uniref:DUF7018 domain-containing (lipo)protein n=1 Tax=Bacillus thuringiensis TaxID=1428 RepID=UPI0005A35576|nr:hypothetical protein [Bacillus thuringiensis]AJH80254.1 hypothetical protein BF36_5395 [Bacillus thuringiensis]QKI16132.1 hypothetical protein FOC88_00325 [Bacillus thuringiensis]QKI21307.1 hypothetical protein FOC88_27455 [Bacillus thuringiensis]
MKRLLLIISILGILTVGCENKSVEKEEKASSSETTSSNTKDKKEILTDSEYRAKLDKSFNDIDPYTTTYLKIVNSGSIQMDNEDWRKEVITTLRGFEIVSNDMISISAPNKYSNLHSTMVEAMQGFSDASFIMKDALAAKDINEFNKGHDLMQKSARKYTEIFAILREIDSKQTTTPSVPSSVPKTTPAPKEQLPPSTYDPKKDSANYDKHGNYKPVDQMTPEEIKKEAEEFMTDYLNR